MDETTAIAAPSGERALNRMRRYTSISLGGMLLLYVGIGIVQARQPWDIAWLLVAGGLTAVQTLFWERPPPLWLAATTVTVTGAAWCTALAGWGSPIAALLFGIAVALNVSHLRTHRIWWRMAGLATVLGPVAVAALVAPDEHWAPWLLIGLLSYVVAIMLFLLNNYGWSLYLEIDAARAVGAELAVTQERYRFAADLHDIQGHTLHVIKLKTQLAYRLVDRDPDAAKQQLSEAEQLIVETLADTRRLAFGDRIVTLAGELANARELLVAAGIQWTVSGAQAPGPHDELFGLVVRETTTNILRHAQPSSVAVTLGPGQLTITNDGSRESTRPLRGLARLGERFEAVGGTLRTSNVDGVFTTEALE